MLGHFHFIQPLWLLALLPFAVVLGLMAHKGHTNTPWRKLVDAQLLPLLLGDQKTRRPKMPIWLLSIGWLLTVLALANPTWEQQPQPLLQTGTSRVIVLDLSRSMLVPDLKPSRMVRARFKVEDILAHDAEGQTGLVVFAGDAFTVAPLTRDADTIRAQLKALDPSIMPSQGSRADLGLLKAHELLQQGGVKSGQVILIADGVEGDRAAAAAARLHSSGYDVSVLGVGTADGAPLPDGRGGTLRDTAGKPLIPRLENTALASVAESGGGRYTSLRGDQSDLDYLLQTDTAEGESIQSEDLQAQKWKEQGPLLAVFLLPLAALAFRRGWILGALLCTGTLLPPEPAIALGWGQLWQRNDQQAAQALYSGDYEQAARLAEDPAQRGSALYKQGDFEDALKNFTTAPGADAAYNRGNALARLNRYKEAISAYDQALELRPGMEDALANKAAVEQLLNQQRQESSDRQDGKEQSSQQDQASTSQDDSEQQDAQEQSSQQEQAASGQGDSAHQDQNEQADSDSSGNHENSAQSEQNQASDPQTGGREKAETSQDDDENQFAEANRQLDKGRDDEQPEQDASQAQSDDGQERPDQQVAEQSPPTGRQAPSQESQSRSEAEALNNEEQMAAQQWLRRIPDDPGGLLRRKFLYQYRQRPGRANSAGQQGW